MDINYCSCKVGVERESVGVRLARYVEIVLALVFTALLAEPAPVFQLSVSFIPPTLHSTFPRVMHASVVICLQQCE